MATLDARSASSSVTQLDFNQAMADFKTMFPEVDEDVIECVLRANNGAVDATIDQLLSMSSDSEVEKERVSSKPVNVPQHPHSHNLLSLDDEDDHPAMSAQTPPPSYNQAVPLYSSTATLSSRDRESLVGKLSGVRVKNCNLERSYGTSCSSSLPVGDILNKKVSNNSLRAKFKWNPPLVGPLPDSFLRFHPNRRRSQMNNSSDLGHLSTALLQQKMHENEMKRQHSRDDDPEVSQFLADERFAILLQNEEFVRELRQNQEFMSQLQLDAKGRGHGSSKGVTSGDSFSDAVFKEMLKNMSKVSRKKFAQVAGMFSRKKKKSFQQLLPDQESSSHTALATSEETSNDNAEEYGILSNESSGDERDSPGTTRKKRDVRRPCQYN